MLLNEPTPHQTRPAEADTAARADHDNHDRYDHHDHHDNHDHDADAGSRSDDGVSGEVPGPRSSAEAPTVGMEAIDLGSIATVALDVAAVKRAVAQGLDDSDAISTISLDVTAVKQAASAASAAEAPTVAFGPVDASAAEQQNEQQNEEQNEEQNEDHEDHDEDELATLELLTDTVDAPSAADLSTETTTSDSTPAAELSTELVPTADGSDPAADPADNPDDGPRDDPDGDNADLTRTMPTHIDTTTLSTPVSGLVAVPETADDVIATIHAAATAVAAADRRARQAAFAKADPWTGLDLHQPPAPAPVDNVLDLLSPVLERPLLVVEQPGLPEAADVVALHRAEFEVDFVEPPVVAAGAEPPIPPRFGPGLSVLPHIEFPV